MQDNRFSIQKFNFPLTMETPVVCRENEEYAAPSVLSDRDSYFSTATSQTVSQCSNGSSKLSGYTSDGDFKSLAANHTVFQSSNESFGSSRTDRSSMANQNVSSFGSSYVKKSITRQTENPLISWDKHGVLKPYAYSTMNGMTVAQILQDPHIHQLVTFPVTAEEEAMFMSLSYEAKKEALFRPPLFCGWVRDVLVSDVCSVPQQRPFRLRHLQSLMDICISKTDFMLEVKKQDSIET